jgi:hypothetical protein
MEIFVATVVVTLFISENLRNYYWWLKIHMKIVILL